jgi:dihydroflavonol-4-reductase
MTVVVTGAAGHLGANLVRALLARERQVRAVIHHDRRGVEGLAIEVVQGDVCDLASLRRAFEGAEVVYHAAVRIAISGREPASPQAGLDAVNVTGTRNVVEACLQAGVRRLIHFSSIHAFQQEPLDQPLDEDRAPVDPERAAPYDRSKAAAEQEVRKGIARGLDAVILNPTAMIGPHDYYPSHVGQVLLSLCQGTMPALIAGGFDWVDVRDVAQAALVAAAHATSGARYLLSGQWATVCQLAAIVADVSGTRVPWFVCPTWLAYAVSPFAVAWARLSGARPLFTPFSVRTLHSNRQILHERATRDLGYAPRPLAETIADALRWFSETGMLDRPITPGIAEES